MSGWFKWCNAIYWLALTLWVAAIMSAGTAAVGVFGVLPRLGLTIERYEPALGADTAEHGRLAGGMVMEPIFTATDIVQVAAAILTVIALGLQLFVFRMRWSAPANLIRTLCIAAAVALVAVHMFAFAPRMNRELRQYWSAVEANDQSAMQRHRAAFDADHHLADRLFTLRLALLMGAVVSSAAALTPATTKNASRLETPNLLRN